MNKNIIEIVTFNTKDGVTEAELLELSDAFAKALKREVDGFLKRSLTKKHQENRWVELVWWDSMESAQAALEKAPQTIEFQQYCTVLEEDGCEISYLEEK